FSPPTYADTNLTLQVLSTITNALCGDAFAATRQWLVGDTNGYQVTCTQTVELVVTKPPMVNCPSNKAVINGDAWTFDSPTARASAAFEAVVYDHSATNFNQPLDPGQSEVGK